MAHRHRTVDACNDPSLPLSKQKMSQDIATTTTTTTTTITPPPTKSEMDERQRPMAASRRRPRSALGRTRTRTAAATATALLVHAMSGRSSGCPSAAEAFATSVAPSHGRSVLHPGSSGSSSGGNSLFFPAPFGATGTGATSLSMASSSDSLRTSTYPHLPSPPTPDEEVDLLTLAVEYLRLRRLDRDLALSRPDLAPPRIGLRAEAAGYGEDVAAYEAALEDGQRARDELITRNMALVHHVVTSIVGPDPRLAANRRSTQSGKPTHQRNARSALKLNSLSRDDLLQEGALGLSRAIDRYDPTGTNGARFATYAVYWIRAAVLRCVAERDDLVKVPVYVSEGVRQLTRAAQRLGIDLDEETTLRGVAGAQSNRAAWKEAERARLLAEEAGLSDRQLAEAVRVRRRRRGGGYTSLESLDRGWQDILMGKAKGEAAAAAVTSTAGASLSTANTAVAPSGHTTDDVAEIRRVLSEHLKPKELEALSWRYGLNEAAATAAADAVTEPKTAAKATSPRDYEEEALEDLFGREGILASYSADPLPSTARAIQSERSAKRAAMAMTNAKTSKAKAPITHTSSAQGGRWGEAMSFAEVGRHMAVSAEYGRRLCSQALKKLQLAADEGRLEFQPDWLSA